CYRDWSSDVCSSDLACSRAPGTGPSAGLHGRAEKLISSSSSSCLTGVVYAVILRLDRKNPPRPTTPREASNGRTTVWRWHAGRRSEERRVGKERRRG